MSLILAKASQEGLKTKALKEGGFDTNSFKGSFYEIEEHIKELEDSSYKKLPISITLPNLNSDNGLQIGDISNPGLFIEKPSVNFEGNTEVYFYPLGSRGNSEDPDYNLQYFLYSDFIKKEKSTSSASSIKEGYLGNSNTSKLEDTSNCDIDSFVNYQGIHSTDVNTKNLLKYSTSSSTPYSLSVPPNIIFSKIIPNNNLLKVEVKDSATEKYLKAGEDYEIYSNGEIRGLKYLNNTDTTNLIIIASYHNYWQNKKDWSYDFAGKESDCWEIPKDNFLKDKGSFTLTKKDSKESIFFKKEITIEKSGNYVFSLYARSNSDTYIKGLHFQDSGESFSYIRKDLKVVYSDEEIEYGDNIVWDSLGNDHSNLFFKVGPSWKRYATSTYLDPGNYELIFYWDETNKDTTLSISGLEVTQDYLVDYDYRAVNYTNINFADKENKNHLIPLKLIDLDNTKDWIISYMRKLVSPCGALCDQIGNISFGYDNPSQGVEANTQAYYGTKLIGSTSFENQGERGSIELQDFLHKWERVLIKNDSENSVLNFEFICGSRTYNFSTSSTSLNFQNSLGDFNLLLGARESDLVSLEKTNAIYRNLWWFPEGLSTEDLKKLKNEFFSFYYDETEKSLILRSDFLEEGDI